MPIRILENEKEGHRKVKTDFRKKRQQEYMKKHGPQQPRRKTLAVTDKYKEVRKKLKDPAGFKPLRASKQGGGRTRLLEELGRVEAEPSNRNRRAEISRVHGELNRGYKGGGRIGLKSGKSPKHGKWPGWPKQPLPPKWRDRDMGRRFPRPKENLIEKLGGSEKAKPHSTKEGRVASGKRRIRRILKDANKPRPGYKVPGGLRPLPDWPKKREIQLRDKHAIGSLVKGAKKIVSKALKPKGVFKPKDKVDQRFLDFIKTGKHVDKHGVKVNVPKAAERLTGKPHVDHGKRKRIKHLGKGKAEGGRIGLRHGGSAGAAKRGHGAEIK